MVDGPQIYGSATPAPRHPGGAGGDRGVPRPLHLSNLAVVRPKCGARAPGSASATWRTAPVRYCKRCDETLDTGSAGAR